MTETISFDGIRPELLGQIRVLSISERFMAEREEQSVSRAGHILASLPVPTVRKITCRLFVGGGNRGEVLLALQRLTAWLETGERRLEVRSAPGLFYWARCTAMSEPEFKGHSAQVDLTFTCRDYRQYRISDGLPVAGADPQTDNFTFAGRHCLNDMGCLFVLEKQTAVPAISPYLYTISGRVGTLRYEAEDLPIAERELQGTLYFVGTDQMESIRLTGKESLQMMQGVSCWLANAGRANLIMDAHPGITWEAEVISAAEYDRASWENGKIKLRMNLQPLGLGPELGKTFSLKLLANTPASLDLTDLIQGEIGFETPVDLKIQTDYRVTSLMLVSKSRNGTDMALAFGGNGFALGRGSTLQVLSTQRRALLDGREANLQIQSGDFPSVQIGNQVIAIETDWDAVLTVSVYLRPRWI